MFFDQNDFNLGITIGLLNVHHDLEVHSSDKYEHLPLIGQMEVGLVAVDLLIALYTWS